MTGVLIHEWIAQTGGSENVLHSLSEIFPEADLICLWNDSKGVFEPSKIKQTWLSRTPLRKSKAAALPLMPATWRRLPFEDYDWALISSHLFAHHARFVGQPADFHKFVYVHTPARYIWSPELDVRGSNPVARAMSLALRPLDRRRAREGNTSFAANSEYVRERIQRVWGVDADVIHPPVQVEHIRSVPDWSAALDDDDRLIYDSLPAEFVLGASRFIPYKRLDLVIKTGELLGLPVVLAGKGPHLGALQAVAKTASVPVIFVDAPSHPLLFSLYAATSLFVFPAVEDFGIMPVEAMAAGAPVLAQSIGGTAETVVQGRTGALVDFESDAEIVEGAEKAMSTHRQQRMDHAASFSEECFRVRIESWVQHR